MRIVIKLGGSLACAPDHLAANVALVSPSAQIVVCHGGSRDIDEVTASVGIPVEQIVAPDGTTTRKTSTAVLDALQMALRGRTQRRFVESLLAHGVYAVGLQGNDGGAVETRWNSPIRIWQEDRIALVRDNYGGRIEQVDPTLYEVLLAHDFLPVICPPAATSDGLVTNIDADRLAARLASAVDADVLCLLTDQPGLLSDPGDPSSVTDALDVDRARELSAQVAGGMRLKLVAAIEALDGGVPRVMISDGRRARPVTDCLDGHGTTITKGR